MRKATPVVSAADLELVPAPIRLRSQCTGGAVADPKTTEMPSGKMTSPPKGRRTKAAAEMPGGAMEEPPARTPAKRKSATKKGGKKK